MPVIIVLVALLVAVFLVVQFWPPALAIAIIWAGAVIIPKVVRNIRKNRYFASEEFQAHGDVKASKQHGARRRAVERMPRWA